MKTNKALTIAILIFSVGAILLFVFAYNFALSTALNDASMTDHRLLAEKNSEIVQALQKTPNTDSWQAIIDTHQDIIVRIKDAKGKTVAASTNKKWSLLDLKIPKDFIYHGKSYYLRSSVRFERDYLTDTTYAVRIFILIIFIVIFLAIVLCCLIYIIMLRPYHKLYNSMENFDDEQQLERDNSKTYTAKVYNRLCELKDEVKSERNNQQRIIASISHDIKTPLTSIMGYSEQLKKGNLAHEREERYLNIIYEKSLEIRDLVNDFDEYLSYSINRSFFKEPFSTGELIRSIEIEYADELENEGIKLQIINEAPGRYVEIDRQKVRRVIGNIVTNSIKHFNERPKIIEIKITAHDKKIYFRFSDSGCGVDEDKYSVIFEPLYTSDQGRKVAGLGLAICREITEAHNGKIWAEKSDLGGLSICAYLPECTPAHKKGDKT